jgi:hypothetical protein
MRLKRVVCTLGVFLVGFVPVATATPVTVAVVGWDRTCSDVASMDGSCSNDEGVDTLNLTVFGTTLDPLAGTFDKFGLTLMTLNGTTSFQFLGGATPTLAPGADPFFLAAGLFPVTSVEFDLTQIHSSNPGTFSISIFSPATFLIAPNTVVDLAAILDSSLTLYPGSDVLVLDWEAQATDVPSDSTVPEPTTLVLLGTGGFVTAVRRRKRQS